MAMPGGFANLFSPFTIRISNLPSCCHFINSSFEKSVESSAAREPAKNCSLPHDIEKQPRVGYPNMLQTDRPPVPDIPTKRQAPQRSVKREVFEGEKAVTSKKKVAKATAPKPKASS